MEQIPKIIHFIWFGRNPYPPLVKMCMESWKKYLPDYQIMEWNEDSFDITSNKYVQQAYEAKKWAFVSDYVRLYALYHYGGIYCDTDVEVLKSLDEFLKDEIFSGFEAKDSVPTGIMGAKKGNKVIEYLLSYYDNHEFLNPDGSYNMVTNVKIITQMLTEKGLKLNGKKQCIDGFAMYPQIYFCPNNFSRIFNIVSKKSYTIHHFSGSWVEGPKKNNGTFLFRVRRYLVGVVRNTLGTQFLERIQGL